MRGSSVIAALGVAVIAALTLLPAPDVLAAALAPFVIAAVLVVAARERRALEGDFQRFALIRGAAQIADTELTVEEVAERVRTLLTPGFAATCAVDLQHTEPASRAEDTMTVPLVSRGRAVGTLRLAGRPFTPDDLEFAQLLSGRIALALENAGLAAEQTGLTTALDSLADAVTIQAADGRLVYANAAAAAGFGFGTPEELLRTPPQAIVDSHDSFTEAGAPVTLEHMPGRAVLRGERPEPLMVRSVHKHTGEERWRVIKATPAPGGLAVNVIEDVTAVKRAEHTQRFLAQAGAVLASSLDYEQTLDRIARLAVPRLGDRCTVALPGGGQLRSVASGEHEPCPPIPLDDPDVERVLAGTSLRLDAAAPSAFVTGEAAMVVPLQGAAGVLGAITFAGARAFTEDDLRLAEDLGRRAGVAVENARLYRERSQIAGTLQRGLLPDALPEIPGLRLSSLYRPAGAENLVGGDFYDAFRTDAGWMLLVGDVTGRGAAAAAQTGQARHTLRTAGRLLSDPAAALAQLNRALLERRELSPCTVAVVHVTTETTDIVCAGHPLPLLIRDGEPRPVGRFGAMLGAWSDASWTPDSLAPQPGDVLVLYTDGVTDAEGEGGRFGDQRLLEALRGVRDAAGAVAAVDRALSAFQRGPQADDTAVLALDHPVRPA